MLPMSLRGAKRSGNPPVRRINWKFQLKKVVVILSERSESKDLGTDCSANVDEMPRSFDSATLRSG